MIGETGAGAGQRPVIALAMGDPAGISPELTARLLADPEVLTAADLVVFGDARVLAEGAVVAGVQPQVTVVASAAAAVGSDFPVLVDGCHLDPREVERGIAAARGGTFALANYRAALEFTAAGNAGAVCFTPFNKAAMKLADAEYGDEIVFTLRVLGLEGVASEFNVLDRLWNARVTSHVALSEVASLITRDRVLRSIHLTHDSMCEAGIPSPRIAVAAMNPHAGDGGNFGREEIEIIRPAVEQAKRAQIRVDGPYPADTVFLRARDGAFDAVVTMYHDQGQIAMKLMGFDRGVTFLGGFPFPICTPAHGTAYEIAGQGRASAAATCAAIKLAAGMAVRGMQRPAAA